MIHCSNLLFKAQRTSFTKAIETMKGHCHKIWEACRKSHKDIHNNLITPLKELCESQERMKKQFEEKQRIINENFNEQMTKFEEFKAEYFEAYKEFDKIMSSYIKALPSYSESKRIKEASQIKERLKKCKDTERKYKENLLTMRVAKVEKASKYVYLFTNIGTNT